MLTDAIVGVTATINLYAIALDSHRYDLFDHVFTPDATTDFGGGATFTGLNALKQAFAAIHEPFAATQHIVSGHCVRVDGIEAKCMSYVDGVFARMIDGERCLFRSTGWYDDALVQLPDGWRIAKRISRMVSASGDHRVMQAMPGVDVDFRLLSLAEEAAAGRVSFLYEAPSH